MAKQSWWRRLLGLETRASATDGWSPTLPVIIDGKTYYPATQYQGAMGLPGAWRAANLVADLIGGFPWDAYRERAGNPIEKIEPTPPLLEQPSPPDTRMTTFSSWALDLLWDGNAIGLIAARNREGWPTAVVPIPAAEVGVRRDDRTGVVIYHVRGAEFTGEDVLHVKGPCVPGALRGMGILEQHLDGALMVGREQMLQAQSIAQHGVPTGLLKATTPDVTKAELAASKVAWLEAQRSRTIAALGPGTDFEPLSWSPKDSQVIEARKYSLHEIALIFGVPLYWLGADQSSRTYSNVEQEGLNLVKYTLGGHLARFEQTLSLAFPRGTRVKANLDSILRADTTTRYEAHAIAIEKGFLTVDEVRELEDLPPLPAQPAPVPISQDDAIDGEVVPLAIARNGRDT